MFAGSLSSVLRASPITEHRSKADRLIWKPTWTLAYIKVPKTIQWHKLCIVPKCICRKLSGDDPSRRHLQQQVELYITHFMCMVAQSGVCWHHHQVIAAKCWSDSAWVLTHKHACKYRWHFRKSGRCLWGPAEEVVSRRMLKGNDVRNMVKRRNIKE